MDISLNARDIVSILRACKDAGVVSFKLGELEVAFTHLTETQELTDNINYYHKISNNVIESNPETESLELNEAELDLLINPSKFEDEVETVS